MYNNIIYGITKRMYYIKRKTNILPAQVDGGVA